MASRHILFMALLVLLTACGGGITPIQTAFNRGVYHYSAGEYEAAIAEYRDALMENDADTRSRFNLAVTLESRATELERTGEKGVGGRTAQQYRDEARALYERILANDPNHQRAAQNLAAWEWEAGMAAESDARLKALLAQNPDLVGPRLALAARSYDAGRRAEALARVEEALDADGTHPDALALKGALLMESGQMEEAAIAYKAVLVRRPEDLDALSSLGKLALLREDHAQARSWLRQAHFVFPRHGRTLRLLADLNEKEGRLEDCVSNLWELQELVEAGVEPGDPVAIQERLRGLYQRLSQ